MLDPETRASLLLKIRDPADYEAWDEFVSLYRPVVLRMAEIRGIQRADAEDLAQQVLLAVSQAIERFEPDDNRAKFRTWLKTIARRVIINAMTRTSPDQAIGGSGAQALLDAQTAESEETQSLSLLYRREIFRVAAAEIKPEFHVDSWTAFWESVVVNRPVEEVAQTMNRSRGSIYTARSRVMARLKEKVQQLDSGEET
ncbi:RNA polymerase sigma factor [Planctomycetes bacterium CA13]|uniref:RNA polymerase sigma factor n=1 Tax=Novipirellula herctigrandis TaxID=2527986 RepID=A0A5C5Z7Y1_9BACT|nr:RNA polymerase sigma factor [Planctomycetes bacterium CA13]